MPIRFGCPACKAIINAPDSAGGKKARCPSCKAAVEVPVPKGVLPASQQQFIPAATPVPTPAAFNASDDFSSLDDSAPSTSRPSSKRWLWIGLPGAGFVVVLLCVVGMLAVGGVKLPGVESADEKAVRAFIEAGEPNVMGAAMATIGNRKYEPVKPKSVEIVQWGPNRKKSSVERICRAIYRVDGQLKDSLFTLVEGKVSHANPNPYGDDWISVYDKEMGKGR